MGFKCGIVGLPNVGKSTLFNALTASKNAEAANFPFCTIDPNIGIVDVIDDRLDQLSKLSNSKKKIYTNITFVDIAGLVKGASKGEGLGNKFLSHIREVDAIIHLVRCFESDQITHVNSKINPVEDLETIKTEIILSDNIIPTIDRDFVIATVAAPTVMKEPEKPAEETVAEGEEGAVPTEGAEAATKDGETAKKDDKAKDGAEKKSEDKKPTEKK